MAAPTGFGIFFFDKYGFFADIAYSELPEFVDAGGGVEEHFGEEIELFFVLGKCLLSYCFDLFDGVWVVLFSFGDFEFFWPSGWIGLDDFEVFKIGEYGAEQTQIVVVGLWTKLFAGLKVGHKSLDVQRLDL